MANWIIRWNFNKSFYSPGEQAFISFWIENVGQSNLYLSDLELVFDFGSYNLQSFSDSVTPRQNKFLGDVWISLPKNVVGQKIFSFNYHLYEDIGGQWNGIGQYSSEKQYFISLYPTPFYKVFLSRGLLTEDRTVGNPITEMIREWGFETVTVGIEVLVPELQVPMKVKEEIRNSEAVIAIATPRTVDALTGLWRTLEWFQCEVGLAFGVDKPLLILKDKRVTLGGLPSYLSKSGELPIIEFDPYNLDQLKTGLSSLMPGFREWIETKRRQEFFNGLSKIAVGGLAFVGLIAILNGSVGVLGGSSKK